MKVQLINPCMNEGYEVNSRNGVMQPLGLISLATYVENTILDSEIEILDGSIIPRYEVNSRLDADVIGCTTGILSYEHALEVAQIAKEAGSMVVFGGPLATVLPSEVLTNRPYVDYIIQGDGEIGFSELLKGMPLANIPNLVWRNSDSIFFNPSEQTELDSLPFPNRDFIPAKEYFNNYQSINVSQKYFRPLSFYSGKGCKYAAQHGRCVFCARMDIGYRPRIPEMIWKELFELGTKYEADCFWDVADSVINDADWLTDFEKYRPTGFSPKFVFYSRADGINQQICEKLKRLNCHLLFVGFESGSDDILKKVGVGKTVQQATQSAKLLSDFGICLMGSFVLGLPGETKDSVQRTVEFTQKLSEFGNLETVSASVIMPLPGSRVFQLLCRDFPQKYKGKDYFNLEDARKDWLTKYTDVSLDFLYDALPELLSVGQIESSLGRPIGKVEPSRDTQNHAREQFAN